MIVTIWILVGMMALLLDMMIRDRRRQRQMAHHCRLSQMISAKKEQSVITREGWYNKAGEEYGRGSGKKTIYSLHS